MTDELGHGDFPRRLGVPVGRLPILAPHFAFILLGQMPHAHNGIAETTRDVLGVTRRVCTREQAVGVRKREEAHTRH